jgi:3-deoxy-D-manno-octulosonic-acid transferase
LNAIYLGVLIVSTPWLLWRWIRYGKNRRGWGQKLCGQVPIRDQGSPAIPSAELQHPDESSQSPSSHLPQSQCIWLHAVSVGEVNLLAPIIERLQQQLPNVELVVSTTTETGYDLARKKYSHLNTFFFPLDFTWSVRRALQRIRPGLIVLAELEIWPNFIRCASNFPVARNGGLQRGIPIAVVNGRLSENSLRGYLRFRFWLKSSFQRLTLIAAQDETYARRFVEAGAESSRVVVTGSVKFDGVQTDPKNALTQRLRALTGFGNDEFVWLAGSTQAEEDVLAAEVYLELTEKHPQLRLILAPRHPERCRALVDQLQKKGLEVVRRSALSNENPLKSSNPNRPAVLLIDVIGELGGWWGVAHAAFVGGSLGSRGGQNMIEPAAYGIPVSFGPNTQNFRAIVEQLLAAEAAVVVRNKVELLEFITRCLQDSGWAKQLGSRAQNLVEQHRGAADRTVTLLKSLLES